MGDVFELYWMSVWEMTKYNMRNNYGKEENN